MDLLAGMRHAGGDALRAVGLLPPRRKDTWPADAWSQSAEYEAWFLAHRATKEELVQQRAFVWEDAAVFSIVVPVYKTPLVYLAELFDSVEAQTYEAWELILVNASPEDEALGAEVQRLASKDPRVRCLQLEGNRGISENTQAGIDAAAGEFVAFLDHDDLLEPDALFRYADALRKVPEIDVLYCDEDLVRSSGKKLRHVHPLLKSAPSPELLLCKNDVLHFMAIRRSVLCQMPPLDRRFDGGQDYRMALCALGIARAVWHEPRVLYHWRMSEGSSAAQPTAKAYGQRANRLAVFDQLLRDDCRGMLVGTGLINIQNIWFEGAPKESLVSVVVDCRDDEDGMHRSEKEKLSRFLESFEQNDSWDNVELLVVVREGFAVDDLPSRHRMQLVVSQSGFFAGLNAGAKASLGRVLVFMDGGSYFVTPDPFGQLLGMLARPGVVASAPKVLYRDERIKGYGIALTPKAALPLYRGYPGTFPGYQCDLYAFANAGAAGWQGLCVERAAFDDVGGFDELYEGEVGTADLCRRLAQRTVPQEPLAPQVGLAGRVALTCAVELHTSEASGEDPFDWKANSPEFTEKDLARYDARWPGVRAAGDPYFNPNLDQESPYFQIAGTALQPDLPRRRRGRA